MKKLLVLVCVLCCLTGWGTAENGWQDDPIDGYIIDECWDAVQDALNTDGSFADGGWLAVTEALSSDAPDPVMERYRLSFQSSWLPAAEKGFANLLLLSTDSPDIGRNYGRADVALACRVNLKTGETRLMPLPQEALVTLPEVPEAIALRFVNCFGGAGLTARCVNDALGLRLSRYIAVNSEAFIGIVDGLNGVELTLSAEDASALGLEAGPRRLNGLQALKYVKLHAEDRAQRVQTLAAAVLDQVGKDGSVGQMLRLADALLPGMDTNLTTDDILDLAFALFGQAEPPAFEVGELKAESGVLEEALSAPCRRFLYGED